MHGEPPRQAVGSMMVNDGGRWRGGRHATELVTAPTVIADASGIGAVAACALTLS